ncbi:MAG TPA: amidohydrolase family protein [Longimicrobiaceae bacterium]
MIIDCHTHLNRYDASQPASLAERRDLLRAEMDRHGIAHALVLTSYLVNPDRPGTEEVLDLLEGDPRFGVVAGVPWPVCEAGDFAALRGLLAAGRLRGLKLYPGYAPFSLSDARMRPVYELAAEFGVPVMIHTGDTFARQAKVRFAHPLQADEVAVDHRETTFVLCHFGNPWFLDAAEVVYKNENVLADVSGLTLGEWEPRFQRVARARLDEAVAYVNDPSKLLFGTDWPISAMGGYLRFVDELDLTAEEREGMMWKNAARVFGIDVDALGGSGRRADGAAG